MQNFVKYYYDIDVQLIDNESNDLLDLNDYFLNLGTLFNFKDHVFPVMEIQLSLDTYLYNLIRTTNCSIRLTILKKEMSTLSDDINTINSSYYIQNEIFTIIDKNKMEAITMYSEHDIPSINVSLTLFSMNHLKINKYMFNSNYLNCRLIDIVSLLNNINQAKILIERPINQKKYEQVLIPPMNVIEMINYIQENYSLYRNGVQLFFDFDTYYVINNNITSSTPVERFDYRNVIFDILDGDDKRVVPYNCGYKSTTSDYYYIKANNTDIRIVDNNEAKQEIFGTNNIIFNTDDDLNVTREYYNLDGSLEKTKLYFNPKNLLNVETEINEVYKRKAIFKFTNLDIETFKCNKIYKCTINDIRYDFRLDRLLFNFIKDKSTGAVYGQGSCIFIEN